jgi:hypothetical protein
MLHFCHGNVNRKPLVHYRNGPGINVKRFVKVVLIDSIRVNSQSKPAREFKEYEEFKKHLKKNILSLPRAASTSAPA